MSFSHKRLGIHIFGHVQGVFFRAHAQVRAQELGLAGWVRNEPDGSVTIEAEGESQALDEFLIWCRAGTPLAKVERMESQEIPCEHTRGFSIKFVPE